METLRNVEAAFFTFRDGGGIDVSRPHHEYSNKLRNRLRFAFDSSPLMLVGGVHDGMKLRPHHAMHSLPVLPKLLEPYEQTAFNGMYPKAAGILALSVNNLAKRSYINAAGGVDIAALPQIAGELANKEKQANTVFRVVFGATGQMPLRALSYMLPPLMVMRELKDAGVLVPQLQLVFTNNIAAMLNGIDLTHGTGETKRFISVATNYVEELFPEQAEQVVFLEDAKFVKSSAEYTELISVAATLEQNISDATREELFKRESNGNRANSLLYGSAHVLFHDIFLPGIVVPTAEKTPVMSPKNIISFGGYQEQFFYRLRQELKPQLDEKYRTATTFQYFTRHHVPPYYMAKGGDISLEDAVATGVDVQGISRAALYDIEYLSAVTEDISLGGISLNEFLERQRKYE